MHISLGNDLSDFKIPDLTDIQKSSYKWFFTEGIQEILQEINPIKDTTGREWTINFSSPRLEKPELTYKQAQEKGVSYTAPWYLNLKLIKEGTRQSKEISQYMGEIPLMTPKGSFIINGVEKIVVMQLTRSYGVLFLEDLNTETGKIMPLVKVLPKYGAWLEMDITKASVLYVKIDKKRKFPVTTLLRIFGLSTDDKIRETFESVDVGEISIIEKTLEKDTTSSYNEAVLDIYKRLRPGEPEILDDAKAVIENMFFNTKRYNMGKVGRFKINQSLKFDQKTSTSLTLTPEDLINIVKKTLQLANGIGSYDVLDDLSNRRVKGVGELLQSQTRIGFVQMERNIKERMSLMPREILPEISSLVSTRPVVARIQSFFASGQLTQYPDQYNSLTALNLMRRVSVLGPGGLTKERASFSVRDVHHSQYSKVDPIHTPEGTSVGLLTYLALYAKVNEFGFLEAPYRKLIKENGKVKVSDEIVYLAAYEERNHYIAEVGMNFDKNGFISDSRIAIRKGEEFKLGLPMEADYIDVIPQQILGLTSGLIPFVANNDPTRSAMASQQITQAVPVVGAEVPLVGTGLEEAASDNARSNIRSEVSGVIEKVDSTSITIKANTGEKIEYKLDTYKQSNSDTAIHFRPKVDLNQKVKKGTVLAETMDSVDGKLAIGANLKVAYMVWDGYNYEDSMIISERLVKEGLLTSVSISDHVVQIQETKLGPEEVTADIPNVSEYHLRHLDNKGVVALGSRVKGGDILVGVVQPRGEVELSAEERLLRAIFGEKAKDVRDVSLRVPHGESGIVIGVKEFTRKDKEELPNGVTKEITVYIASLKKIGVGDKLSNRAGNKGLISKIVPIEDMPHTLAGEPIDIIISSSSVVGRMNISQLLETSLGYVAYTEGNTYDVPAFTKLADNFIEEKLKGAKLPESGKEVLIDGRTGEAYDKPVLIGHQYILKLHHMAESKIHARSTGPYSLITQQPLGGRAQMGGQRFGEMEVWALEAYGASNTLHEMLNIKSDNIQGRNDAYRAILRGEKVTISGLPESFKLLVRELNGLGLALDAIKPDIPTEVLTEEVTKEKEAK